MSFLLSSSSAETPFLPLGSFLSTLFFLSVFWVCLVVASGPGLGPAPVSQFGTISRQISRHNPSNSSISMVSATGTYRRAPSVTSQFSLQQQQLQLQQQQQMQQQQQPHINGGTPGYGQNSSKALLSMSLTLKPKLTYCRSMKGHSLSIQTQSQTKVTSIATKKTFIFFKTLIFSYFLANNCTFDFKVLLGF